LLAASRTAIDGFEPPDPLTGTVVLGTALTVVLVVGATVPLGASVEFPGELSAAGALVPWAPVEEPAGDVAGAASAEAGPEPTSRKSPARSAKDAAHLRGLTTSFLGLELICVGSAASVVAGCARTERPAQGRGICNMALGGRQAPFWAADLGF
jgi:hypothetical protein